ncbi:MAG: acyltransferase [Clostridiales bacterium]|nr:acyltransferase [Clostridiales bacterium]
MNLFRIPKTKKTYLDVIKLLAIGMVVFNHSGNNGYKMYLDVLEGPAHQLMLCWSAFIKIAVPLFFMASGALMLKKEEPYGRILGKRVLRFALILIAVSLFFYWEAYGRKGTMSVPDFLLHLYRNDLTGHLWYLYSYLCYLLMLPFLRKLARAMKGTDYLLLVIVYQAAQLLPAADYALFRGTAAHTSYISFFVAADYVVYPLLGHYIDSLTEKEEREETVYILLFLSILAVFLTSVLMDWRCGVDGGWTNANREAYMGRLSVFPAITVFYCVRKLFARLPVKNGLANVLFILGSCTFGVYLFDPKWRQLTQSVRTLLTPSIGLYFATHVQTICACLLGLAATFLFKCVTGGAGLLAGRLVPKREGE